MKTTFILLVERCGLSLREAAAFLQVPHNTITSVSSGRRNAPPGMISELRALYARIEKAADSLIEIIDELDPDTPVDLGLSVDDIEAQSLGWPCVGAHAAALGIVAASVNNSVVIVPRGTTSASAAAADAHDGATRLHPKR